MSVTKEEITFSSGNKKSPSILTKAVIVSVLVIGCALFVPSIYSQIKKKVEISNLKKFDRYEAIGGRSYQGVMTALNFVSAEDKRIIDIELEASDTPLYLNHSQVSPSKIRPTYKVLEMNRFLAEAIKSDVTYLDVNVTTYVNKFTKDRFHLIMDIKEIPPVERKVDMDSERSIFRHPDTYEVITKDFWQEIMKERKEIEDFKESVATSLKLKPEKISKYTRPLLKGWTNDKPKVKPLLVNGKCLGVPDEDYESVVKEITTDAQVLIDKYNYEYMTSVKPVKSENPVDIVKSALNADDEINQESNIQDKKPSSNRTQTKSKRKVKFGV